MNRIFILLQLLLYGFVCVAQNDSINTRKKLHFVIDLSISPNLSFEDLHGKSSYDHDFFTNQKKPFIGFNVYNNYGIQYKASLITVGFGYAYYSYKGNHNTSFQGDGTYSNGIFDVKNSGQVNYYCYSFPVNYTLFFGRKKSFFSGLNLEISSLYKFNFKSTQTLTYTKDGNVSVWINETKISRQKSPQMIFWPGIEFGGIIKIVKWYQIKMAVDLKYSSFIKGSPKSFSDDFSVSDWNLTGRNLFIISFNISSFFKF